MASTFHLTVVAPDKSVVEETVSSMVAPGESGYFGVLRGHSPLIAALKPGLVEYQDVQNQRHYIYVGGGFAEVSGERVTILADEAQPAREIDIAEAEHTLEEARKTLRGEQTGMSQEAAVAATERAVNRIRAARQVR